MYKDPLKFARYAENECQAWYNANDTIPSPPNRYTHALEEPQVLSLYNIRIVDGS